MDREELKTKLKEIFMYYKEFYFESKKEDIKRIETITKNNEKGYMLYLSEYDKAKDMNLRLPIIKLIANSENRKNDEKNIIEVSENWSTLEKMIKDKKLKKMKKHHKNFLNDFIKNEENEKILHKIFSQDQLNNLIEALKSFERENLERKEKIASEILSKCTIYLHTNKKGKEPFFIYDKIYYGKNNIEITYDTLIKKNIILENSENYKKFVYFLKKFETEIKKIFIHNYNLTFSLELENENNEKNAKESYNIKCIYTFFEPINHNKFTFKEKDILINGANSNNFGFYFLLNEINSEKYKNIEYIEELKNNIQNSLINESTMSKTMDSDPEKVIELIRLIGKHNFPADYIVELSDGYLISGGSDNYLILYESNNYKKILIKGFKGPVFKVGEKINSNSKGKGDIKLYCIGNEEFDIVNLDKHFKTTINQYLIPEKTFTNFIEMKENDFIISGKRGSSYYTDLFNKEKRSELKITNKTYCGGIKIDDQNVAITSNDIIPNGENKLLLFNTKNKKIYSINDYSFIASVNGLALMTREYIKCNYRVLLCACKRYKKEQKNGILLVNPQFGCYQEMEKLFYETDDFEVYCFCPISDNKMKETDYFFVGGFDSLKKKGAIKLFKILFGAAVWGTKIEFMQDIDFKYNEKFEGFQGPINSIIQSKVKGNVLVTCYDGNVYLFTPPNIDYYLEEDINA